MKKGLLFLLLSAAFSFSHAQTIIENNTEVSGIWTKASSPYIVNGEAIIPAESTLIIEPGVEVRLKTGTNGVGVGILHIKGVLIALGTKTDSITFTRDGDNGFWGILLLNNSSPDTSQISYSSISYASDYGIGSSYRGAITVNSGNMNISNSRISNSNFHGISLRNTYSKIFNNHIETNERIGILCDRDCKDSQIANNYISGNMQSGIWNMGNSNSSVLIFGNVLCFNTIGIQENWASNSFFINNTIYGNIEYGIRIQLESNEIMSYCINNIITNNHTNIFNTNAISVQNSLLGDYSLPGSVIDEGGNIYGKDPSFSDTLTFQLKYNSPSINSGTIHLPIDGQIPLKDIQGNSRINYDSIDIGATEFFGSFLSFSEPESGEYFQIGQTETLYWKTNSLNVKLEYKENLLANWNTLATIGNDVNEFLWEVPDIVTDSCLLRISDLTNTLLSDTLVVKIGHENIIVDKEHIFGTWTKEKSPYIIMGEAIVPNGKTLLIEPGVVVEFAVGTKTVYYFPYEFEIGLIHVKGKLIAKANFQDSIYFTRHGNSGEWGCIWLDETIDTCVFEYSNFEFSKELTLYPSPHLVDDLEGVITSSKSVNMVSHCRFTNNYAAFEQFNAYSLFENNSIINNHSGVLLTWSKQDILNNTFRNNEVAILCRSKANILNNLISENNTGIRVYDSQPLIQGNEIINNKEYGINGSKSGDYLNGYCIINSNLIYGNLRGINFYSGGAPKLTNNLIYNNSTGLSLYSQYFSDIYNNTISGNQTGIINDSKDTRFRNNITSNNKTSFELEKPIVASNNIFEDSLTLSQIIDEGENIIVSDFSYKDTLNHDYSLLEGSLAINAGTLDTSKLSLPNTDLIGNSRISNGRIDIGAYEFQDNSDFVRILKPYDHEYLVSHISYELKWNLSDSLSSVKLIYSSDKGVSWQNIVTTTPNDGIYEWKVPELFADSCLWAVVDVSNASVSDTSRYFFTISPNIIPDGCEIYGTFKQKFSPYQILGIVTVPKDSALIIEPGTEIKMKMGDDYEMVHDEYLNISAINVYGKISAVGYPDKMIRFTSLEDSGNWGGVVIYKSGNTTDGKNNSEFDYCILENAYKYNSFQGAINISYDGAYPYDDNDSVKILNSVIQNCYQGIYIGSRVKGTLIRNCLITNNSHVGIDGYRGDIINSTIANNYDAGISGIFNIENCVIHSNAKSVVNPFSHNSSNDARISYSLLEEESLPLYYSNSGGLILNLPPQFIDPANRDYNLEQNSPCIDTGDPSDDFSNEPEPNGGRINMGVNGNTNRAASFLPLPRIDFLNVYGSSILGNDTLTIAGNYFLPDKGAGSLIFDSVETPEYLEWNDTTIVCIIPPHINGKVDLLISNNDGLITTRKSVFSYNNPEITRVDEQFGNTGGGKQIELNGQNFGEGQFNSLVYFGDQLVSEIITWSDTVIRLIVPANTEGFKGINFVTEEIEYVIPNAFVYTNNDVVEICGEVSGVWEAPNLYIISCDVLVPQDEILEIEAGVMVVAESSESPVSFTVDGTLHVLGTETDSVIFTSVPGIIGSWEGIIVNNSAVFDYADIGYAIDGIRIKTTDFNISNSTLSYNQNSGIFFDGDERAASGTVQFSDLKYNQSGIVCDAFCYSSGGGASPEILNNRIYNNVDGIYCRASGGVPGQGTATRTSTASPVINGNKIYHNQGNAISCFASESEAESYQGITMRRIGYVNPQITNNIIYENSNSIKSVNLGTNSNADLELINNVIYNSGTIHARNSKIAFLNSIIGEEVPTTNVENYGFVSFDYCSVKDQTGNNLDSDPMFVDPSQLDFRLSENSPCIDAGFNDFVYFETDFAGKIRIIDGLGTGITRVDIGAYEYNSIYVDVNNQEVLDLIKTYPNPTKGLVQVEGLPINEIIEITVLNLSGMIVSQFQNTGSTAIIDITNQSKGVYLIKLSGKTQATYKIVKE